MTITRFLLQTLVVTICVLACSDVVIAADRDFGQQVINVLTLRDYNTRVVLFGTTLLGISGGVVGVFMLLRKQSLVGDVVGHSALPGIALAFILVEATSPGEGKHLPTLLIGAFIAGTLGAVSVMVIDRFSLIKADAAMAIVLSLFYGAGTALLTVVQRLPTASAAGLKDFLAGKTASLVASDVWLFSYATILVILVTTLLFKELCLLCFDDDFAAAIGLEGLLARFSADGTRGVGHDSGDAIGWAVTGRRHPDYPGSVCTILVR